MTTQNFDAAAIAKAFTDARQSGKGMSAYPGTLPTTLAQAYAIQDAAIDLWSDELVGWKIGGIDGDYAVEYGYKKLAGPVFKQQVYRSTGAQLELPVYEEGFAAIEGEIVLIVNADAPIDKTSWTEDEARAYVGSAHIGVEIASSPFPDINNMGPLVTISDFGNNYGLIIGQELENWENFPLGDWVVNTVIADEDMGTATPPGPLESFRFVLGNAAARGRPIKKGMVITTGAITGVHQAYAGQTSTVSCSGCADINMKLVPFT